MEAVDLRQKIQKLPEPFMVLVNDYVDELLLKAEKINSLQGSLSSYADKALRTGEHSAWLKEATKKHSYD